MKGLFSTFLIALILGAISKYLGFEVAVITGFCIIVGKINDLKQKK